MAGPIPQIPVQEDGPDLSASHSKHSRVLAVGSRSQIPATLSGGSFLNEHTFLCFMNEGKREWNSCPLGRVRFLPLCTQPAAVVTAWAWQRFWECCCSGKCILEKKMKEIERERLRCRELGLPGWGRKGLSCLEAAAGSVVEQNSPGGGRGDFASPSGSHFQLTFSVHLLCF